MIQKFKELLAKHKIWTAITVLVVAVGGYYLYSSLTATPAQTKYVLTAVKKGNLISTVSGSGQVAVSDSVDLKPKTSGDIIYVGVANGQEVNAGQLVAEIDPADAQKAVSDAQTSLETAKLQLDKLTAPVDELTLLQAENSLTQSQESLLSSQNDLVSTYASAYTDISNAYIALPSVMTGLNNILYSITINKSQNNVDAYTNLINNLPNASQFNQQAVNGYQSALAAYTQALADFKNTNVNSSTSTIENLLSETSDTLKSISVANSNIKNLLDLVSNTLQQANLKAPSQLNTDEASMQSYISIVNGQLSTILNMQNSIQRDKNSIVSAQRSINEKTLSLADIKAGSDSLTIRAAQIAVQQQQDNLATAQQNLSYCYIRAPFTGIISKVNVQKGDSVSSGAAVATLITKQQIAQISLNEVDAAKVKVGQKATLTFDAISDLNLTGTVSEVETVGTVSQGVVTYTINITLDAQDSRVKPGMSVTAVIITETKMDVLLVSGSAVKTSGSISYVEIPDPSETANLSDSEKAAGVALKIAPTQKQIEIGSSNDTYVEVISGLKEGDLIISKTSSATSKTTTAKSTGSSLRIPGMGGGF
jgi:HlyD family secretion protein